MLIRYATRALNIDGIDFNSGDIIPMNIQIDDDSDAVRYEGGKPDSKTKKAAVTAARRDISDAGLSSASFQAETIITKASDDEEVKTLFVDGDAETGEDAEELGEQTTEVKTEEAPARGRGRNAQSE